jgi:hypothetical protein
MRSTSPAAVLTAVLVAVGSALVPSAASAAPPRIVSGTALGLQCTGGAPGSVVLTLDVEDTGSGERAFGTLAVLDAAGQLILTSAEGQGSVIPGEGALTGNLPMLDGAGTPVGEATFDVGHGLAGNPTTTTDRTRTGNAWQTVTTIQQPVSGTGSVLLPSREQVPVECSGQRVDRSVRTMPDASVLRLDPIDIGDPEPDCVTDLGDGRLLVVAAEGMSSSVSVSVREGDTFASGFSESAVTSGREVSATVQLVREVGEEVVVVGDAVVALQVDTVTATERWVLQGQHRTSATTREEVVLTGTVTLPGDGTVPVSCDGRRFLVREVVTSPAGPQPGGRAPVNDTADGAVLLARGDRVVAQTGGAAARPEADLWCDVLPPADPSALPGRTVWYRFTGTGGPVTVDTAGSSFDTVLSVHEAEDTSARIACADDDGPPVRTLQAYTTVDTEPGVEYLVQVGGAGAEYGRLRITLS